MIDTVRFNIFGIEENDMQKIKSKLEDKLRVDNETGEIVSQFTQGSLEGSYDYRISVMVKDHEYVPAKFFHNLISDEFYDPKPVTMQKLLYGKKPVHGNAPVRLKCKEYLTIEFSLAKWVAGVNFFNTPLIDDIRSLVKFRIWFQNQFSVTLPQLDNWELLRVDMAINYDFDNLDNIRAFINLWRNLEYPRRRKPTFYNDSLYLPGSTFTVKMYAKHPEFKKHDYKRIYGHILSQFPDPSDTENRKAAKIRTDKIHRDALGIFRFEIEVHKRKLRDLNVLTLQDLVKVDWRKIMANELKKLIGNAPVGRVYTLSEVTRKLEIAKKNGYIKGKGITKEAILAVWTHICTQGDKAALQEFGKMKVSRAKKVLKGLKIGYVSTLTEQERKKIASKCDIRNFHESRNYNNLRAFRKNITVCNKNRSYVKKYDSQKVANM